MSQLDENQIGVIGAVDFDSDGAVDLITSRTSGDLEEVTVFLGTGDGGFELLRASLVEPHDGAGARVLADVNGDGSVDIVTGNVVWLPIRPPFDGPFFVSSVCS